MESLVDILARYPGTDKNTIHSYGVIYESLFAPIRDSATNVLEVGVRDGSSLLAWQDYFPNARIVGIDDGSEKGLWTPPDDSRIAVKMADTTRPESVLEAIFFIGWSHQTFDLVIDDGLHHPYAQAATWATLWPRVKPGGLYITEDVEDIGFARELARLFRGEVIDRREVKMRHDDIVVVWRKP